MEALRDFAPVQLHHTILNRAAMTQTCRSDNILNKLILKLLKWFILICTRMFKPPKYNYFMAVGSNHWANPTRSRQSFNVSSNQDTRLWTYGGWLLQVTIKQKHCFEHCAKCQGNVTAAPALIIIMQRINARTELHLISEWESLGRTRGTNVHEQMQWRKTNKMCSIWKHFGGKL